MSATTVRDEQRVARVRDQRREPIGDPEAALGGGQQHDAAVRGDAAAVEGCGDFLAADGWKANGSIVSSDMAGVARRDRVDGMVSTPNP